MKTKDHQKFKLWFDRLLSKSLLRQLGILAVGLVIAFVLSYILLSFSGANWQAFCKEKQISRWLLPLYLLIDSNALNILYYHQAKTAINGWMLFASSITFLIGAFIFNGAIIGIITNAIEQRVRSHREGHLHYLKSGHYIIMGYDEMVPSIISHIFKKDPEAYVLLMSAARTTIIREKLKKVFSLKQQQQIIINYGHRMSTEYYKDIHLEAAEQIYIVGLRTLSEHDAVNVECLDSICRYLKSPSITQKPNLITCVFKDLDTYASFKTSDIFTEVMVDLDIEFVPYNFYTGWAKQVFVKRYYHDDDNLKTTYRYPAVYGNGITPDDTKRVHLVFVGTTNFAVAFAMESSHILHFPNYDKAKTMITFIDINADKEKDEFITRNRHYFEIQSYTYRDLTGNGSGEKEGRRTERLYFTPENGYDETDRDFLDVEFEFIKGDIFSISVQEEIRKWATSDSEYLSIFLSMADQRQNFVMGMNMPDEVYDREIPLFIQQNKSDNLVTNLRNADTKTDDAKYTYATVRDGKLSLQKRNARYANIYPFGMDETAYCADEHALTRAKFINYLYSTADYSNYKFREITELNAIPTPQIMSEAEKEWKKLPMAIRWSNIYNAFALETKLATLRAVRGLDINDTSHDLDELTEQEVEMLAVVEHNRWNVEKLLMGFRKSHADEDSRRHKEYADSLARNKKLFIHHDIRTTSQLGIIHQLDKEFTRYIPWILSKS